MYRYSVMCCLHISRVVSLTVPLFIWCFWWTCVSQSLKWFFFQLYCYKICLVICGSVFMGSYPTSNQLTVSKHWTKHRGALFPTSYPAISFLYLPLLSGWLATPIQCIIQHLLSLFCLSFSWSVTKWLEIECFLALTNRSPTSYIIHNYYCSLILYY